MSTLHHPPPLRSLAIVSPVVCTRTICSVNLNNRISPTLPRGFIHNGESPDSILPNTFPQPMTDPPAQATDSVYVSNTTNVSKAIAHPQPSSTPALTSPQLQKYLDLPQHGKVIAEYVWIDADGGTRSKSKVSIIHPSLQQSATCACNATQRWTRASFRRPGFSRACTMGLGCGLRFSTPASALFGTLL